MRRQLVAKLVARRSPRLVARPGLPLTTSQVTSSPHVSLSYALPDRICKRNYADGAAVPSGIQRPIFSQKDDSGAGLEADRKQIHAILFPSIPTHLIPGPIKNANLDSPQAVGLSPEEVLQTVSVLVKALETVDKTTTAHDVQEDRTSVLPENLKDVEGSQAGDTVNDETNLSGGPSDVRPSNAPVGKHKKASPFRPSKRLNTKLSAHYAELTNTIGPYVPHIGNALGLFIREASQDVLEANEADLEKVSRWCFVHSFDGSHVQGRSNQSLRDFHIAGKERGQEAGSSAPTKSGSASALAAEKANLVRRAQSAYEQLLSRWAKRAIADRASSPEAGAKRAERILQSIEETFQSVGRQLALIHGEGIEGHIAIHQKTRNLLAGAFKERIRAPMREILALWTKVSVEFGSKGAPLRDVLPQETITLGLLKLIRGVYPDQSRIWIEAVGRSKVPATGETDQPTALEDKKDAAVMQAYTERLANAAYMRSQSYLRSIVRSAASRSDMDLVLSLWQMTKKHLEQNNLAECNDRLETLCAFLQVLLRTMSFAQHAPEVKQAVGEIFGLFPNPTPLPIYHTLLSVYGARFAVAMAKNLPGGSTRGDTNAMHQNLKVTWNRMKTEGVARDLEAYRLAVTGFGTHGDFDGVRACWQELHSDQDCRRLWMRQSGASSRDPFPPIEMLNVFITTFLNSPKASGAADTALGMFARICDPKTPYKPDIVTVNIMLKHYVATNDIESMSALMAKLSSLGLKPDVVTYTTIVDGLLKSGKRDVAKDTLDLMQSTGVVPSTHTYGLLIGDLARSGTKDDMARADALVKRMRLAKLTPSTVTYTALLGGYFRANMIPQALTVLKQMERDGTDMDIVTYNMVLRSIVNSNVDSHAARKAVKRVGGNGNADPSGFWRTIIDAMLARRIAPNDDTWFIALSGLHRSGRFEEGDRVIEEMQRQRFRPLPGSSLDRSIEAIRQRQPARPARFR